MYDTTTLDEFISYLKPKLLHFVKHNFVTKWEDKHFKLCIKPSPTNIVVFVFDFVDCGSMKPIHRTFWHVNVGDVDRISPLYIYDLIKGIMKICSICATNKNNLTQLLVKIWHVFVIFVWTISGHNAKMFNGHANGCQNNFNHMIFDMYKKQCINARMEIGNSDYKKVQVCRKELTRLLYKRTMNLF